MNRKMQWSAALLLTVMMLLTSVFSLTGVASANEDAQDTGLNGLTAVNIDELLARFTRDAELSILARSERYVGATEISRYLESAVPDERKYTLIRADRSENGFSAVVEVSDRDVRWARLTLHATVRGPQVTRLEVAGIQLLLWAG